ncbi:hypothetical protein GX50_07402 [[Emmonsia] crescens]|uniref:Uncharacterized protein n=1 Tax=[Emmonsia] crescens TaxID=73230 RepID=A0A2B7Z0H0_9EURO|nr:hypothetical protein GX50_07402 [Emmonsia crescens]
MENLTSTDVKTYFDYLERTHNGSIKAASALNDYWRALKSVHCEKTDNKLDERTVRDCLRYKKKVIKRWKSSQQAVAKLATVG